VSARARPLPVIADEPQCSPSTARKQLQREREAAGLVRIETWLPRFELSEALFNRQRLESPDTVDTDGLRAAVEKLLLDFIERHA
jgi:hypothetical protein